MNKEKIVEELNEWSKKEFGSLYSVVNDGDDLTLLAKGYYAAWFRDFKKGKFRFQAPSNDLSAELIKKDIIKKFYDRAIEVLNECEPKYTVQVFPREFGFLYKRDGDINDLVVQDLFEDDDYCQNNYFTESEIAELKKNDDVAIDWDKAIIKEVD